jgi:drug/metabolite transporter (DMT)-like permease
MVASAVAHRGGAVSASGRGAAYALAAYALYSAMDAVLKHLAGSYHPFQVAFLNALFAFLPFLACTAWRSWHRLRTARPRLHLLRGTLSVLGAACNAYAIGHLALAEAYAVLFAAPILVAAMAVPLLGERAGWRSWAAVALGFAGVLVMLRPEGALWSAGGAAAVMAALCNALGALLVRFLQKGETGEALSVYGNLATCLGLGLTLPFVFTAPTALDLLLSVAAGLVAGFAYLLLLQAYRLTSAAQIAPCQYTQMPYALLAGFMLFGTRPDPLTLVGAAIVMASGLLILRRAT